MNALVKSETTSAEVMENVLIRGDIAKLTVEERGQYYFQLCQSLGLNALTQPFEYIQLNGKLRLYAKKDCTDQLRSVHGISVTDLTEGERDGVFTVKAKVSNAKGRTDVSTGAVSIKGLAGEALANALMKAETKAKRRATLSICGLGMLDETEIEDIPASAKGEATVARDSAPPRRAVPSPSLEKPTSEPATVTEGPHKITGGTYASWATNYIEAIGTAGDPGTLMAWIDANQPQLDRLEAGSPGDFVRVKIASERHLQFLRKLTATKSDPITSGPQAPAEPDDTFPGDRPMNAAPVKETAPRPRGRPPKPKVPDFQKDYDGWVAFQIKAIADAPTIEALEAISTDHLDAAWPNILDADKTALREAISLAEDRMAP